MTDLVLGPKDAAVIIRAKEGTVEFLYPYEEPPEEVRIMLEVLHEVVSNEGLLSQVWEALQERDGGFDTTKATEVWH